MMRKFKIAVKQAHFLGACIRTGRSCVMGEKQEVENLVTLPLQGMPNFNKHYI